MPLKMIIWFGALAFLLLLLLFASLIVCDWKKQMCTVRFRHSLFTIRLVVEIAFVWSSNSLNKQNMDFFLYLILKRDCFWCAESFVESMYVYMCICVCAHCTSFHSIISIINFLCCVFRFCHSYGPVHLFIRLIFVFEVLQNGCNHRQQTFPIAHMALMLSEPFICIHEYGSMFLFSKLNVQNDDIFKSEQPLTNKRWLDDSKNRPSETAKKQRNYRRTSSINWWKRNKK